MPSSPAAVRSSGQSGGITAYWVGNVIINKTSAADPGSARMVAAMAAYRDREMAAAVQTIEGDANSSGYTFLTDDSWPNADDGRIRIYLLTAADSDDFAGQDYKPICAVTDDIALGGFVEIIDVRAGTVHFEPLNRSSGAVFQPLCRGLSRPLSTLTGSAPAAGDDVPTIYDMLAGNSSMVAIAFMPGRIGGKDFEVEAARYFWVPAMQARYEQRSQTSDTADAPERFEAWTNLTKGRAAAFSFGRSTVPGDGLDAYPPEARSEFGARLGRFDADWVRYVTATGMSVRGRAISGVSGAGRGAQLPRFSPAEIGSNDFWRAADDVNSVVEMTACLAGGFLDAKGYRIKESADEIGRCGVRKRRS